MEKVVLIDSDKVLESFSISEKRVPELMDFIVELLIKAQEDESSNIYVKNKEDGSYEFRGLKVAELLLNDFAKQRWNVIISCLSLINYYVVVSC